MGKYSDWARSQSKYLIINPGESVKVEWTGKSILSRGRFGEAYDFDFKIDSSNDIKIFSIRNTRLVSKFDNYNAGDKLTISRSEKDADGKTNLTITKEGDLPF